MRKIIFLLCLTATLMLSSNLGASEPEKNLYRKVIEIGKAKDVKTELSFLAGELQIDGTSEGLAECYYGYKKDFIRPELSYYEVDKTGYLSIKSESLKDKDLDDIHKDDNKWRLSLNNHVRNSVAINLKAGEANIDLEGCNLSRFEYRMFAGESNINLRNTSVPTVMFNLTAGEANVDLSGSWQNDLVATIKGGVGELNIKVPYNTGVRITVSGLLGDINIPFFNRDGRTFTNDKYGKTKNTLYIDINGGIGEIKVDMVE